ncbi:MAG TPA: Nramp family divalent metal transporter [Burkholderiales bacterium]|nr:Nramp family divalent metal transporter [Burkholderiales bacterium]
MDDPKPQYLVPRARLIDEHPEAHVPFIKRLGPGLITGAADDDPSGIATYSQAGAQYGYGLLWSVLFTTPLMIGIQVISARIGRVTGHGLAANIREHFPRPLLITVVGLLLFANTLNIAADLGAMGNALELIAGGKSEIYIVFFALVSLSLQIFVPFPRYAPILKWLTLALLAYVGTVLVVQVPLDGLLQGALLPRLTKSGEYAAMFVAVLGTTISPYLFFWQASQEVEEQRATHGHEPLREAPEQARAHLRRIKLDTYVGMIYSNVIALCIMLTTAVTLHGAGITDIATAEQAAQALRPIAGPFAFQLFALGIIGTGLLAVPVLAGSAAYAVAESLRWPIGLGLTLAEARGFYVVLSVATLLGVAIDFYGADSIRMLVWAAMVNGIIAVPIMGVMMLLAAKPAVMGPFVIGARLKALGWLATAVMAAAVVAMVVLL